MLKKTRPRFDYSRMRLASFSVFAQGVVNRLTGNIHFQNPPYLDELSAAVNKLKASMLESANRDTVKIALRQADRKVVEQLLKKTAGWLMGISSDPEILMTSGMEIAKGRGAAIFLGQPRALRTTYIAGKSCSILLRWKQPAENRARMFVLEQTDGNPADEATIWKMIGYSKKCRFILSDLTRAKTYSWRVYGIGPLGNGGKSQPVSAMVI